MTLSSEEKLNKKREYERNYKKSEKFKKKRREYERNYRKTQKFKAKRRKLIKRKYDRDPQYKIKQNELNKKWRKTKKGKKAVISTVQMTIFLNLFWGYLGSLLRPPTIFCAHRSFFCALLFFFCSHRCRDRLIQPLTAYSR